jgi:hypothetical protein
VNLENVLSSLPVENWRTRQVIAFEWYDGPRQGVCALASPPCEFFFEIIKEQFQEDDLDDRWYRLSVISPGTVDSLINALRVVGPARQPIWTPLWRFPSEREQQEAEDAVDEVKRERRPTPIIIHSRDMIDFLGYWPATPAPWAVEEHPPLVTR